MSMVDLPWRTMSLTTLPVAGEIPKPWAEAVTTAQTRWCQPLYGRFVR